MRRPLGGRLEQKIHAPARRTCARRSGMGNFDSASFGFRESEDLVTDNSTKLSFGAIGRFGRFLGARRSC